jgi:MFS family permease
VKSEVGTTYRNYVLAMLTLVYVFNFIDRQLLVILQESIKKELLLTDTQLGLLSGFTFAIFYVTMGIPIARLADRRSRRNIVAVSLALWSAMTAFCGLARNFVQLLLARIGVGVGEAGGSPPAHAMISDYFPPQQRATALSVYSTGIYFGMLIGFLMGGYLNEVLGWRTAFFVLGIPGIVFSLLFFFTVREPRRGAMDVNGTSAESHSFMHVLRLLLSKPAFVYLALATGLHAFCIYGVANWAPSFLQRLHSMSKSDTGIALGLIFGIGGGVGTYLGGYLTDRFAKQDKRRYLQVPAFAVMISIPCLAGALFLQDIISCLIFLGLVNALYSMYLGPSIAVVHSLVPASMRALSSAVLFLILNLIGLGFGPLVVGILSDALAPTLGANSLRWSMSVLAIVSAVSTALFLLSANKLRQ